MNKKSIIVGILSLLISPMFAEQITFKAESMSGTAGNSNSSTILQGNAQVKTESMEIAADRIELSGKDFRYIKATGSVKGKNTQSQLDFTCGSLVYDRETSLATLSDDVNLKDTQNDVTAQAQIIEYNQNTEVATMQINVTLTQKDNNCTAAYAIYKKNEQQLEMSGNPQLKQGADTFRAQTITLDLSSQEVTLSGRVKGSVTTTQASGKDSDKDSDKEPAQSKQNESPDAVKDEVTE